MTSIAVTASVCASASEAALLVASFMSNSLDLGMAHRCAKRAHTTANDFYSEHPATSIRFDESPLSEYRPSQNRPAIRRQFGPRAPGLCARDGVFWRCVNAQGSGLHPGLPRFGGLISPLPRGMIRPLKIIKTQNTQGDEWPVSTTAIPRKPATAPAKFSVR